MSGHSKWSTIKHKKAKTDAQRGKIFTKIVREISSACRGGGEDPEANPRLRLAIQKAKDVNMPSDNIKRAVQKGLGAGNDDHFEEVMFEGYAFDGIALLISTLTDNRNRTVPNIRSLLSKSGGNLAAKGAVSYLFEPHGVFVFEPGTSEEKVMEVAILAGADDITTRSDGSLEVVCPPDQYEAVRLAFEAEKLTAETSSLSMIPTTSILINFDQSEKLLGLIEKLEDDDDVQAVYSNADIPDDVMARLSGDT